MTSSQARRRGGVTAVLCGRRIRSDNEDRIKLFRCLDESRRYLCDSPSNVMSEYRVVTSGRSIGICIVDRRTKDETSFQCRE